MEKPDLHNAKIVRRTTLEGLLKAGISKAVANFILEREGKEIGTGDAGINTRYTIIGPCETTDYIAVSTDGANNTLSMFRLVGGCNHLYAFNGDGVEKSEDYDDLADDDICQFSDEFEIVQKELLTNYIGKTLRIVARTAEGTAPFDRRYYLFTYDK